MTNAGHLSLICDNGKGLAYGSKTLASWKDSSIKWLLLDIQVSLGAGEILDIEICNEESETITEKVSANKNPVDPKAFQIQYEEGQAFISHYNNQYDVIKGALFQFKPEGSFGGGPYPEHNYATGLLYLYWMTGHPKYKDAVASFYAGDRLRKKFEEKSHFFFEYSLKELGSFETRRFTRPMALVMSNGMPFMEMALRNKAPFDKEKMHLNSSPKKASLLNRYLKNMMKFSFKREKAWIRYQVKSILKREET